MATCCVLGRNRPLLISVGLIGGLLVTSLLAVWLVLLLVGVVVLLPAAPVSGRARRLLGRRVRALAVTLQVSREKVGEVLDSLAPRTRCRVSTALMRVSPGAAGFVYRHFVGLAAVVLCALGGVSYAVIRGLGA